MNRALDIATRLIRASIEAGATDPAALAALALDQAHLLAVPGQLPAGEPLTELEAQALAWDQACARTRLVADAIRQHIGQHPEVQSVAVEGTRVLVALHVTDQGQWSQWRRYFAIEHDGERPLPYAVCGDGYRDGVRVSVVAYGVPQVRARATQAAVRPYELDGTVYDLSLRHRDADGRIWVPQGHRIEDGMPLLAVHGRPEMLCALANVVTQAGPLTPIHLGTPAHAARGEAA